MTPRFLYVHVPFCVRRCAYCDFAVDAVREPPVDEWIRCIVREMELLAAEQSWDAPLQLETLYIGGGTPSLLGTGAMGRLRRGLEPWAILTEGAEWTCEANPESFTAELARDWRNSGVDRISLGAQTFHAESLRWMGRLHGADGPGRAMAAARSAGFDDVSVDLIFGLPERLGRDWKSDLELALRLEPDHLSLYGLTAEEATPLGRWVREGRETIADEDRYADEYLLAHHTLTAAGFEHYEVSNFARPGRESRHNSAYWTGEAYAALGPGAHSLFPPLRRWNERSWDSYRAAIAAGELPVAGDETVTPAQRQMEEIWLGLRTSRGYGARTLTPAGRVMVDGWIRHHLAVEQGGSIRLTAEGWLLLDKLAADLSEAQGTAPQQKSRAPIDDSTHLVQISATSNHVD